MDIPVHALLLILGLSGPPVPEIADVPKTYGSMHFCQRVAASVRATLATRQESAWLVGCVPIEARSQ